jgi:hypothetical protein
LTVRGTRDGHVSDRDTRVRIQLTVPRALELSRTLTSVLPGQVDCAEILAVLEAHHGDVNVDEDAVAIARRLSAHWRDAHDAAAF